MEVTSNIPFDSVKSYERLSEIIDSTEIFEEVDEIPSREKLTYKNGYYVNCYSIFIDVRDSSQLPTRYRRPTLAKIYRAFISEIVALFQSYNNAYEINIVGDSVWAVFKSSKKSDVLEVFSAAYTANSIVQNLNYKLCQKGIEKIKIGIGIAKGRALMIQAGFKGSGIKDVIWMGHVVNQASKMCSKANKVVQYPIVISSDVYNDLSGHYNYNGKAYQSMLTKYLSDNFYYGNIVNSSMENWLTEQQSIKPCI